MKIEDVIAKVGEDNIREAVASDDDGALKKLFEDEGIALTDEQLEHVAGGVLIPHSRRGPRIPRPVSTPTPIGGSGSSDDPSDPNWTGPDDPEDDSETEPDWGVSD